MNTNLSHLPEKKQKEIAAIVEIIKEEANPEKIILFGSHVGDKHISSELYSIFRTPPLDEKEFHLFDLLKRGYIDVGIN